MGESSLQEHARLRHGRRHLLRHRARARRATRPKSRSPSTTATARRRPPSTTPTARDRRAASSARPGSAYRINGREVRARDVQLLFADASTGARSPALVRQGQIGELINAKPQARRAHPRRGRRHLRPAHPPPRGRAAAQGRRAQSRPARRRRRPARASSSTSLKRQARQAVKYKRAVGRHPQARGDAALYAGWVEASAIVEREQAALEGVVVQLADQRAPCPRPAAITRQPRRRCRHCARTPRSPLQRCAASRPSVPASSARSRRPSGAARSSTRRLAEAADDATRARRAQE